jgi:hypothetical protein
MYIKVCPPEMFLWKLANLTGIPAVELQRGTPTHLIKPGQDDPGCLKSDKLGIRHCHGNAQLLKRVVAKVVDHTFRPEWAPIDRPTIESCSVGEAEQPRRALPRAAV